MPGGGCWVDGGWWVALVAVVGRDVGRIIGLGRPARANRLCRLAKLKRTCR